MLYQLLGREHEAGCLQIQSAPGNNLRNTKHRRRRALGVLKRMIAIMEARTRGKGRNSITMTQEIDRKLLWRKRTVSDECDKPKK